MRKSGEKSAAADYSVDFSDEVEWTFLKFAAQNCSPFVRENFFTVFGFLNHLQNSKEEI